MYFLSFFPHQKKNFFFGLIIFLGVIKKIVFFLQVFLLVLVNFNFFFSKISNWIKNMEGD